VGTDPDRDLAVIEVDADDLTPVTMGRSDSLELGDSVIALGFPLGLGGPTVTKGIVSGLDRTISVSNDNGESGNLVGLLQTDAAINPGNSGGALVDAGGNLIGINTAIYSRTGGSLGIGFAIPVSTAQMVLEQIVKTGSVARGWIGVGVQEITRPVAESFKLPSTRGALIAEVLRGGPADKAGIKPGDVLVEVEGKPVADPNAMLNLVAALPPGNTAKLKLRRGSRDIDATITVGRRPKQQVRGGGGGD